MKKVYIILLIITASQYQSSAALNPGKNEFQIILIPGINPILTIEEFLKLKPSDIKRLTGKKLSLKEVIALKFTQSKIKIDIQKNRSIDKFVFLNKDKRTFKWHWGGFFLGLLLPFGIGIIISALKKNERKSDRVMSAAIGTAITSLIIIILVLSSFSGGVL